MFGVQYLENGQRCRLDANGAPIGNDYVEINWSRDWWRHVTQTGHGRDPNCVGPSISKMAGDADLVGMEQDKTSFISQKDHKATYIAIKESSTLRYISRTTAIRIT